MGELAVIAGVALVVYLVWCAFLPYARCPPLIGCGGKRTRGDRLGHFRLRGKCWLCGSGRYRRIGARLLGVG